MQKYYFPFNSAKSTDFVSQIFVSSFLLEIYSFCDLHIPLSSCFYYKISHSGHYNRFDFPVHSNKPCNLQVLIPPLSVHHDFKPYLKIKTNSVFKKRKRNNKKQEKKTTKVKIHKISIPLQHAHLNQLCANLSG